MAEAVFADIQRIPLQVFHDARGHFMETYRVQRYASLPGLTGGFVQDNCSYSTQGVLRGLHFQQRHPQGKLIQVLAGKIFDVAVDVRLGSATFGRWQGFTLSADLPEQLWIAPGYAHGFVVLSDAATIVYKCTDTYRPDDEVCLRWDDAQVAVNWPWHNPVLSDKDRDGHSLGELRAAGLCIGQ